MAKDPTKTADPATKATKTAAPALAGVQITYVPGREDPVTVTWARLDFEANKPRTVNDPRLIERAKGNPWFKVEGEKQAEKGFDPANDKPVNSNQYRAYAITWFNVVNKSAELKRRWSAEEDLRVVCEVGQDDLDYIARFYDQRLEQLTKMENAGEAQ